MLMSDDLKLIETVDGDGDENSKKKSDGGWTVRYKLKAASILATLLVSLLSIMVGFSAHKKASDNTETIESTRVETGAVITNSNEIDYTNPWLLWEESVTPTTTYIGVKRNVHFKRPFNGTPSVSTAFSLIDIQPIQSVLTSFGYHNEQTPGLQDIHLVTMTEGVTKKGFMLKIGIGVRREPGEFLATKLQTTRIDPPFVREMLRYHQLSDRPSPELDGNELWMANFYRSVGSIQASWIAKNHEK
jgi:hypothetical protein